MPAVIIILTVFVVFLLLAIPFVQTKIARGITGYISNELNTTLSVRKVEFSYFNRLVLTDILIKDQNRDTLLYSPKVSAAIRNLDLINGRINLGKVIVEKPVFAIITDSAGTMNLTWYIDKITGRSDSSRKGDTAVRISRIDINEGRFSLINVTNGPGSLPVDFSNLRVSGIQASVDNLTVMGDSVRMHIADLSMNESNGFIVKSMESDLVVSRRKILFTGTTLECDSSSVSSDRIEMMADSLNGFSRFIEEVRLDVSISRSSVSSSDLRFFVPFLKGYNESFWLSGRVTGTVAELKGRNIEMNYGNGTSFNCDFDFSGLPDTRNTFIFLELNDFRSISGDIEQITVPGRGKILLPDPLRKLGVVSFSGTFTGFVTDFVTYGRFDTEHGIISTDISLRPEEGGKKFLIKGLVKGSDIDLGSISGNSRLLGKMTVEANVDGSTEQFRTLDAKLTGRIDSVEINDYIYRNILLNGSFANRAWDGNINIADRNLNLDLLGMFDFNRELPEFDFTMNLKKANLFRLNIDRNDTTSVASLLLTANFAGNSLDNLDGEIRMLNSSFRKFGKDLEVYDFSLRTFTGNSKPAITLRTDFVDASLNGRYSFPGMSKIVKNILAALIPVNYPGYKPDVTDTGNDFQFEIKFKDSDRINDFLKTGLVIARNSTITGMVRSDSLILVNANSKVFSFGNNTFTDLAAETSLVDTVLKSTIKSRSFNLSGLSDMKDLTIAVAFLPDRFSSSITWDNKERILNKGSFSAAGSFHPPEKPGDGARLIVDLLPGEVYSRNNLWKIYPSQVTVDTTSIGFKGFSVKNNENFLTIDGAISEDVSDTLNLRFNGMNLSPLNNLYEKRMGNPPDIIHLSIGGTLNGKISLTNLYRNFMFESDLQLKDFTLLESRYGEITINSAWNSERKIVDVRASNNLEGVKMFDIYGTFDPGTRKMDLTADANRMPVDALNPLLKMFASDIRGTTSGRVSLSGELSKPYLTGALLAENASLKIDYIQSRYSFTDSVRFDRNGIRFRNIQFRDERGNTAQLNGTVFHNHFKDFNVDLSVRTSDCMVLNTRSKDNEMFYGTAFASGVTTLKSTESLLRFDISARTGRNTRFYIPLNTGESVAQNTYISFVEPRKEEAGEEEAGRKSPESSSSLGLEVAFDLDITPDAEIQLIMDPKTGDIMKGTGTGRLNISLDKKGALKIYGDYTIDNGSYLFTLGNLVNKSFDVENGGQISFNGDVDNAEINIRAKYKTKASLYEIMPQELNNEKLKERIPVECHLLLTGRLFSPLVAFDIYLPTADEETRAYLRNMIKSDEDMSRQFLFLLVMGSFYADQSSSQPNIGSSAVGLTTMEMLSNQLSNWLSQISNDFDIGVAYRPGSTNLSNSDELQVALSTQILNDRVVINGNFDVEGSQSTSSQTTPGTSTITGAFDIEYKINEKIRFKFFNRSNDNFYIDNGVQYTQGIGLFYREDFDRLRDLLKKKEKGDMKKEDEVKPAKR